MGLATACIWSSCLHDGAAAVRAGVGIGRFAPGSGGTPGLNVDGVAGNAFAVTAQGAKLGVLAADGFSIMPGLLFGVESSIFTGWGLRVDSIAAAAF